MIDHFSNDIFLVLYFNNIITYNIIEKTLLSYSLLKSENEYATSPNC